jgi:hypothetical protein
MEAIEIIKAIALLCQITVATSGVARDARLSSEEAQKECHKYYAKCIHSPRARMSYDMADDLRKCMENRK